MIRNKFVLAALLIDFVALNIWAFYSSGLSGLVTFFTEGNAWAWVFAADIVISLFLVLTYMWKDAKKNGESAPIGLTIVTAMTGSIGPLIYLLRKPASA